MRAAISFVPAAILGLIALGCFLAMPLKGNDHPFGLIMGFWAIGFGTFAVGWFFIVGLVSLAVPNGKTGSSNSAHDVDKDEF